MRLAGLVPALAALFFSSAVSAQTWDVYVNRDNFFSVNLPGEPKTAEMPYKTAKGTNLTAHVFTAVAPPGSRLSAATTSGRSPLTSVVFCHAAVFSVFENTIFGIAFMRAASSDIACAAVSDGQIGRAHV